MSNFLVLQIFLKIKSKFHFLMNGIYSYSYFNLQLNRCSPQLLYGPPASVLKYFVFWIQYICGLPRWRNMSWRRLGEQMYIFTFSWLRASAPFDCNVVHCSSVWHYFIRCFGVLFFYCFLEPGGKESVPSSEMWRRVVQYKLNDVSK